MAITVTSKEFNQRASYVLKLSETQPVFITKWGKIVSVLSNYQSYRQVHKTEPTFEELFSAPVSAEQINHSDFTEFEQTLADIRKNTQMRDVEFD